MMTDMVAEGYHVLVIMDGQSNRVHFQGALQAGVVGLACTTRELEGRGAWRAQVGGEGVVLVQGGQVRVQRVRLVGDAQRLPHPLPLLPLLLLPGVRFNRSSASTLPYIQCCAIK